MAKETRTLAPPGNTSTNERGRTRAAGRGRGARRGADTRKQARRVRGRTTWASERGEEGNAMDNIATTGSALLGGTILQPAYT